MDPRASTSRRYLSGLLFVPWLALACTAIYLNLTLPPRIALVTDSLPSRRVDVKLIEPPTFAHLRTTAGHPIEVRFRWDLSGVGKDMGNQGAVQKLEFCETPNFPRDKTRVLLIANFDTREKAETLGIGHYFWRVRVGSDSPSETRELWIEEQKIVRAVSPPLPSVIPSPRVESFTVGTTTTETIQLRSPTRGQEFFDGGVSPAFTWRGTRLGKKDGSFYKVEIAPDSAFRKSRSIRSSQGFVADQRLDLAPGTYFWRVRLVDRNGDTRSLSRSSYFVLHDSPPALPPRSRLRVAPETADVEPASPKLRSRVKVDRTD